MTGAAWHPDPTGRHELRWWDGTRWSEHVSDHGIVADDPATAPRPVSPQQALPQQVAPSPPSFAPQQVATRRAGAPPGGRRRPWLWAAVAAVIAIGVGAGVVMTIGSDDAATNETSATDDESADEDDDDVSSTSVATPSTAPATIPVTATTMAAATSLPVTLPSTVPPTAPPTTEAPATAPPTTVPHLATVADLVAALPPESEIPSGWTSSMESPVTDPVPATSPHDGMCGGADDLGRALAHGVTAAVWSPTYWTEPDGWAGLDLYAFATEADASAFMAESFAAAQSCGGTWTYTMDEGDGPDQYDGFSDGYGDGVVVWTFVDLIGAAPAAAADTPEAFDVLVSSRFSTVESGTTYGGTVTRAIRFERHGRVALIVYSDGECCLVGFGGIDPGLDTVPTNEQVAAAADVLRPGVVARLAASGAI